MMRLHDDGPFFYGAVSRFKHFQESWTGVAADTWNPRWRELPDVTAGNNHQTERD